MSSVRTMAHWIFYEPAFLPNGHTWASALVALTDRIRDGMAPCSQLGLERAAMVVVHDFQMSTNSVSTHAWNRSGLGRWQRSSVILNSDAMNWNRALVRSLPNDRFPQGLVIARHRRTS